MIEYIVVQAGGKGTRLEYLTQNKPKALVPVENLPMLFHLFHKYPDKKFIIIADYKKEVLREYLSCFAKVKYQVVDALGTGTCAGVGQALALLPEHASFMLVWSDLILPESLQLPDEDGDYIGISQTFPCRRQSLRGFPRAESWYAGCRKKVLCCRRSDWQVPVSLGCWRNIESWSRKSAVPSTG